METPKYGDYPELFWDLRPDKPIDVEHPAVLGRMLMKAKLETIRELVPFETIERNIERAEMPYYARRFWAEVIRKRRKRIAEGRRTGGESPFEPAGFATPPERQTPMDSLGFAQLLGQIIANLQGLEFYIRVFLTSGDAPGTQLPTGMVLQQLKAGDIVSENSITNFESLGQLIDRYNQMVVGVDPDCEVDRTVVELRDAIAHGRATSLRPDSDVVLLKFSRPRSGQVTVTYAEHLTEDWLKGQVDRLYDEVRKVHEATGRAMKRSGVTIRPLDLWEN